MAVAREMTLDAHLDRLERIFELKAESRERKAEG